MAQTSCSAGVGDGVGDDRRLIAVSAFGLLIGWIRLVLRSLLCLVLVGVLVVAYFAVKGPPED